MKNKAASIIQSVLTQQPNSGESEMNDKNSGEMRTKASSCSTAVIHKDSSLEASPPLDCAMCGASNSFVISPLDPAVGYCFKEQQAWRVTSLTCVTKGCFRPKAAFGDQCMKCLEDAVNKPPALERHSFMVLNSKTDTTCYRRGCGQTREAGNHYTPEDIDKILERRRAIMPDYDERLKEWLS